MIGMHSTGSSSNDSTRSVLYSILLNEFPQVSPDEIISIIQRHGHNAGLCRQLVEDASSRFNPVFSQIHNLSVQPGADGYHWPNAVPALLDPQRQRDSGIHTLSPVADLCLSRPSFPASSSVSPIATPHTPPSPTPPSGKQSRGIISSGLNKFTKHLGIGKKHAPSIFVPAPLPNVGAAIAGASSNGLRIPQSATPSTSSPSSPTPPPRRNRPPLSGSVSNLANGYDDVADVLGGRRTSAPGRPPLPNNHSRPFVPMARLDNLTPMDSLNIDITGHSPTAGSGYDFAMNVMAQNPNAFDDDLLSYRSISVPAPSRRPMAPLPSSTNFTPMEAQRIHFERLKAALDASKVVQKELEQDIESLASFKSIQLKDMGVVLDVSSDELEAVKKENGAIQIDIDELRRKINQYERISGLDVPPQLPPKPQSRATSSRSLSSDDAWACLRCTGLNHCELPRCEFCFLPRIIAKPASVAVASVSGYAASAAAAPCYCCRNSDSVARQSADRSPSVETERLLGLAPPSDQPMDTTEGGDGGWVMVDVVTGQSQPLIASSHV